MGTGLAKYNSGDSSLRGQAEYYVNQADAEQAARQQRKALERTMEPGETAALEVGSSDRALARQDLSGADAPADPLSAHTRHLPRSGESFLERGAIGMSGNSEQTAQVAADAEERALLPML